MSRPGKRRFSDTKEEKPAPRPLMELDSRPSALIRRPMPPHPHPMVPRREQDIYSGPVEYLPAGTRGFLISTCHGQEEFALDEAMELLRVAAVQLNGGMKAGRKNRVEDGFVPVNFLDLETVKIIPNPDGEDEEDEKKEDEDEDTPSEPKAKKERNDFSEDESDDKKEIKEGEQQKDNETEDAQGNKEEEMDDSEKKENENEDSKLVEEKESKPKNLKPKPEYIFMKSIYKFKAYRTEVRNCLFIACDHPEPSELAGAAMGLVGRGFPLGGDALVQLIPVLGVADFNLMQLEVMARRVLGPLFVESEPPVSYALMLHDKLSEQPGSHLLCETLRSVVWALDPRAAPASPLTEPALTLRLEVLGSKLCLAALPDFVRFRQYSPTLLAVLGHGEPEDDDLTWACQQQRHEYRAFKIRKRKEEKEMKALELKRQEQKKQREAARLKQEKEMEKKREEKRKERQERQEKEEKRILEQAELARQWAERQAKENNQSGSEVTEDQKKEATDAEPAAEAMDTSAAAEPERRRSPVPLSPPRPEPTIPGLDLVEDATQDAVVESEAEAAVADTDAATQEESQPTEAESQPTEAESQSTETEPQPADKTARPTRKRKARK